MLFSNKDSGCRLQKGDIPIPASWNFCYLTHPGPCFAGRLFLAGTKLLLYFRFRLVHGACKRSFLSENPIRRNISPFNLFKYCSLGFVLPFFFWLKIPFLLLQLQPYENRSCATTCAGRKTHHERVRKSFSKTKDFRLPGI